MTEKQVKVYLALGIIMLAIWTVTSIVSVYRYFRQEKGYRGSFFWWYVADGWGYPFHAGMLAMTIILAVVGMAFALSNFL